MKRSGDCRVMNWAMALANALTVSQSSRRASGTTRCKPLPPLVLTKASSPNSSSNDNVRCAASSMAVHGSAGSGSRSSTNRSGVSILSAVAPQGCNSIVPICTAPSRALVLSISIRRGWPGSSAGSSCLMWGMARRSACFWKNCSPSMPSGARNSDTGRWRRKGRIHSLMLA